MATILMKVGIGGVALAACIYPEAGQNIDSRGANPIIIATLTRNRSIRPVVTVVGERPSWGWPDDVEGTAHEFPMPLTSIPAEWISPLPMAPRSWRLFLDDGRRMTVGAIDVVTLPGDNPIEAPERCLTSIHVRSWFHESRRGMVRAIGSEIGVDFGCRYLTVDAFPEAVVQIGALELWLGQNYYEDGFEYDAYHFRNGRLESVRSSPVSFGVQER